METEEECDEGIQSAKIPDEQIAATLFEAQKSERNADVEFQKGLEELVRDHFDSCMALASSHDPGIGSSGPSCSENREDGGDEHSVNSDFEIKCQFDEQEGDVEQEVLREEEQSENSFSSRQSRILNQWYERRAEQVMTTMERQTRQAELLALAGLHAVSMLDSSFLRESRSERIVERPRPGTSRLVQMWRGLECDQQRNIISSEENTNFQETAFVSSEIRPTDNQSERNEEMHDEEERTVAGEESQQREEEVGDINVEQRSVRQIMDRWTNERTVNSNDFSWSRQERNELLDLSERERVRQLAREWLQRRADSTSHDDRSWEAERRRDRQLILDLLVRTERERQRELEGLSEHHVVSRFPHRGRLQSFLRGRFLRTGISQEEEPNPSAAATELGQLRQRRAVSGIREGFRYRLERIVSDQASDSSARLTAEEQEPPSSSREESMRNQMNDLHTYNIELQELLGRRSVSNILASEFRDRLDQLIRSLIHRQVPWPIRDDQTQQQQPLPQQQQQQEQQEQASVQQLNQSPPFVPPPPPLPWQQETPQTQWPRSRSSSRSQYVASENGGELREDISRLQQGLGDLQRMVETCLDMQLELQRSIRQEVAGALQRMYGGKEFPEGAIDGSPWTPVNKGICCICCDKSIDSLLYRCGHMCTCLKCATQLMQSESKCPMCRAPISEVVRAFTIA